MILLIDAIDTAVKISLVDQKFSIVLEKKPMLEGMLTERLLSELDKLLKETGKNKKILTAVAVNRGPGSYTGLRISVSTANFLAYCLDIPVYSFKQGHQFKLRNRDESIGERFVSPVIPFYKKPPHIT